MPTWNRKKQKEGLTPKEIKFCEEYLRTGNATQSWIGAGYKKSKASDRTAHNKLRQPEIKQYIENRTKEIQAAEIATTNEVLKYWTKVMRQEIEEEVVGFSMDGATLRAEKKPSLKDANKASELLGKTLGMFENKLEISGDLGIVINVDYGDDNAEAN